MPDIAAGGFTVRDLDATTWDAFAEFVERNGGIFGGCWCMGHHADEDGERYKFQDVDKRATKEQLVRTGRSHHALVYDEDGLVQGFTKYGSRAELPIIEHSRRAYEQEPPPVPDWRITCYYTDKNHRRKGIGRAGLEGALDFITLAGGGLVEAMPEVTAGRVAQGRFLFEMTVELYEEYGFERLRQIGKHRWIVHRQVKPTDPLLRPELTPARATRAGR